MGQKKWTIPDNCDGNSIYIVSNNAYLEKGFVYRHFDDEFGEDSRTPLNTQNISGMIRDVGPPPRHISFIPDTNRTTLEEEGLAIYWHCTSMDTNADTSVDNTDTSDKILIDLISAAMDNNNTQPFKSNLAEFYSAWYNLYGVRDMREIWFNINSNPTQVDIVLQVREILDLDLATTELTLSAVLDIEWTDNRLNWSGFCTNISVCPDKYEELFCQYNLASYRRRFSGVEDRYQILVVG